MKEHTYLQRKKTPDAETDKLYAPVVDTVLSQPGQPLEQHTRASMEPQFGHDFGQVRS